MFATGGKSPGDVEALALSKDPLRLRSARIGDVQLMLGHQFRLVRNEKVWKASTTAYRYQLFADDDTELIAWHWHPDTNPHPHIHVPAGVIDRRVHVPTGRVSIEAVVRVLLTDLGVAAKRDDFERVLDKAERDFIEHRSWHGRDFSQ